ncbi:unnamed protein product, partial [Didymodactylos carnosus]
NLINAEQQRSVADDEIHVLKAHDLQPLHTKNINEECNRLETKELYKTVNTLAEDKYRNRLFAIIFMNGTQRKVTTEDIVPIHGTFHPTIGDRIRFEKVLLVGSPEFTVIGRPLLSPHFIHVEAVVIEKTLSPVIIYYYYAPKKKGVGTKKNLQRMPFTLLRITDIDIKSSIPGTSINSNENNDYIVNQRTS